MIIGSLKFCFGLKYLLVWLRIITSRRYRIYPYSLVLEDWEFELQKLKDFEPYAVYCYCYCYSYSWSIFMINFFIVYYFMNGYSYSFKKAFHFLSIYKICSEIILAVGIFHFKSWYSYTYAFVIYYFNILLQFVKYTRSKYLILLSSNFAEIRRHAQTYF